MKKIGLLLFIVSLGLFVLNACKNKEQHNEQTNAPIPVKVQSVGKSVEGDLLTASGKLEAKNSANLSTRMMGYVTKVYVTIGQKVNSGDLIISINNTDLEAKKAQVDANISQATAAYNSAKKDYERFVNLFKEQSASQKELDDMTARYEMAKAGLEGAKEMKKEVLAQFAYSNITAPFSGVVTNTFIKAGDMANPGMPLVSIEGTTNLQALLMVAESDISEVKEGMPVQLIVKSINKTIAGKVIEISGSAIGGQYLVKASLNQNDAELRSGMFVNAAFQAKKKSSDTSSDVVLVPQSALINQGQLTGIYTIGEGNVAILRWLRIGKTFGDQVEVLSGLSNNEEYIASSDGKLFNGAKVVKSN
ncbi:MAG: efflux RND transporter periplasmic adaptor subunit [Sphingobacteriales bacterium]|nr:efflux RND transporter periplasmic adaptor subunit [Sphingobacteriales bacterium]